MNLIARVSKKCYLLANSLSNKLNACLVKYRGWYMSSWSYYTVIPWWENAKFGAGGKLMQIIWNLQCFGYFIKLWSIQKHYQKTYLCFQVYIVSVQIHLAIHVQSSLNFQLKIKLALKPAGGTTILKERIFVGQFDKKPEGTSRPCPVGLVWKWFSFLRGTHSKITHYRNTLKDTRKLPLWPFEA